MLTTLLTVAILHWVALITPGPNMLLVSQLAASGYRGSACIAGIGVSVVAVIWALLAILGLNALFAAHAQLRLAMQMAGGLYLCYVAFKLWRSGARARWQAAGNPGMRRRWRLFGWAFSPTSLIRKRRFFSAACSSRPCQHNSALHCWRLLSHWFLSTR